MSPEIKWSHGGARPGAGRKNIKGEGFHQKRPRLGNRTPVYLHYQMRPDLPSLRRPEILQELIKASQAAKKFGFRIVAFHLSPSRMSLMVESFDNKSLTRGVKSFAIRLAKAINKYMRQKKQPRKGSVYQGRYKIEILRTISQVREAYLKLFQCQKKPSKTLMKDPFSSALFFTAWKKLLGPNWEKNFSKPNNSLIEHRKELAGKILSPHQFTLSQIESFKN